MNTKVGGHYSTLRTRKRQRQNAGLPLSEERDAHEALVIIAHHFRAGGSITYKMWSGMQGLKERGSQEIGVLGGFDTEVLIKIKVMLASQVSKLGSM